MNLYFHLTHSCTMQATDTETELNSFTAWN